MQLDYYRQTTPTQFPLPFAGHKKYTSHGETGEAMDDLQARIKKIIEEMPGPPRGKQVRLAKIAGEEKQTVNHWVQNRVKVIQYDPARRICEHFGYRIDWLMKGKGPMRISDKDEVSPTAENLALVYLTAEEQQIITEYRSTNDIGRAVIRAAAAQAKKV